MKKLLIVLLFIVILASTASIIWIPDLTGISKAVIMAIIYICALIAMRMTAKK